MSKLKNKEQVKNRESIDKARGLRFSFLRFKLTSIHIPDFNNHYKDSSEYIKQITNFLNYTLPQLSCETAKILSDKNKKKFFHFHKIESSKYPIIERILEAYGFPQQYIDSVLEGETLYQLEIQDSSGAVRIIFEVLKTTENYDTVLSFLFFDSNHHIYPDKAKIKAVDSFNYKFCPVKANLQKKLKM